MKRNLLKLVESRMSTFSKGQRLIAKYVIDNYDKAAYMTASKLGAASCNAYDIDPVAVKVTRENAEISGCKNIKCGVSDLLSGVERQIGGYDVCVANIVAEIIIRMLPDIDSYLTKGAPIILSGIVAERAPEVIACAESLGYKVVREERENDWVALMIV